MDAVDDTTGDREQRARTTRTRGGVAEPITAAQAMSLMNNNNDNDDNNGTTTTSANNNRSTYNIPTNITVSIPFEATADVCDTHIGDGCRVPQVDWRSYGRATKFSGIAVTLDLRDCPNDNSLVKETLVTTSGIRKVLVVGANGSRQCALMGDNVANAAVANGWCGIVLHGCVRDSAALSQLPLGIVAIGTMPQRSNDRRGRGKSQIRVDVGGVTCYPGDQVFCDSDGVVVLNPPNVFRN